MSGPMTALKGMAGTTRLELATSAVTEWEHQVLPTTYKAVGDCQVLENTHKTNTFRVGHRVEKGVAEKDCRNRSLWVNLWVRILALQRF